MQLDVNDPKYPLLAAAILDRHNRNDNETNITSAIRDFLVDTGLARREHIVEENPPSDSSRRAVDLTALDTFVEVKRRLGTAAGFDPNPEYVRQLDDYLRDSQQTGKNVRMGVLTDGKYWLLRWAGAGAVNTAPPYAFVLENPDGWLPLYEWLRDKALTTLETLQPDREALPEHFGPGSPLYRRDIDALSELYRDNADAESVRLKRRLWRDLLQTALGEIAGDPAEMDDLFVRHTYLSAVIGMVVQAAFGVDLSILAETDPDDALRGARFRNDTGLQGVVESDFFAWPAEVAGGSPLIKTLARRVGRFDWGSENTPSDIAAILYQTVIPAEERRTLGEYYTPVWLARSMTQELITDPLNQRVLDPACGSGSFIVEAVSHYIAAAREANIHPTEIFSGLRGSVIGIDIHPAAVHLARAAYALAARQSIKDAGYTSVSLPVYLGDSLQLRFRSGDMFAEHSVTIQVENGAPNEIEADESGDNNDNLELVFPVSLIDRADIFDALISDVAEHIERGDDPYIALADHAITIPKERAMLESTLAAMSRLRQQGRNHIWAYYTRNMVRPVALSRAKVDVIIGNPPWINYNQTVNILRTELEELSNNRYGIWAGGRYASNQDVAGLFFTRCADLYLKDGGVIGFVMPHSTLQSGQHAKWRSGLWQSPAAGRNQRRARDFTLSVDFGHKTAWDLEQLEPNTFFPIASCVVFARSTGKSGIATPLAGEAEVWRGETGTDNVRRLPRGITDTSVRGDSPYDRYSRMGAAIRPRRFFFVEETENPALFQAPQTITVNPRRGSLDKKPWNELDLTALTGQTIELTHLFNIYMGETIAPYVTLQPLQALLPFKQGDNAIPSDENGIGGISMVGLERRMRQRWQIINRLWETSKSRANRLNLLKNLDYLNKISSQLAWRQDQGVRPTRIVYTTSGLPTAAVIQDNGAIIDETLYWVTCQDTQEANYLLAIINSNALAEAAAPLMAKGQFGARSLHKHLWKLPIPEYDVAIPLHSELAVAGAAGAVGARRKLAELRAERGERLTVAVIRRQLRAWLRSSPEGAAVESAVARLLAGGGG